MTEKSNSFVIMKKRDIQKICKEVINNIEQYRMKENKEFIEKYWKKLKSNLWKQLWQTVPKNFDEAKKMLENEMKYSFNYFGSYPCIAGWKAEEVAYDLLIATKYAPKNMHIHTSDLRRLNYWYK